jgi:hypothetical protein
LRRPPAGAEAPRELLPTGPPYVPFHGTAPGPSLRHP